MRRLAVLALITTGVIVIAGATADSSPKQVASLSLRQLAGQKIIYGFDGHTPPSALARRIRAGEGAGVILFSRNVASRAQLKRLCAQLQAIPRPRGLRAPLLIMIDQEGGVVKRLRGAPEHSAAQLGRIGSSRLATDEGRGTARNLRAVGVNVDLAPVLDAGRPGSDTRRLGRSYAARPSLVARLGVSFARGLETGNVAATAKHFPGLGAAKGNEDFAINRISLSRGTLRGIDEAPFAVAARARIPLVMVSTAIYPAFDRAPALFSRRIVIGELRRRLHYGGVTISDDLEVPAFRRLGTPAARAVRSARAGVDLLLMAQHLSSGAQTTDALVTASRHGDLGRDGLEASAERVLRLRASLR
jgi:beta-N-acetylhexosaminidase